MDRVPRGLRLTKTCTWLEDDLKNTWVAKMRKFNRLVLKSIITLRERNLIKIHSNLKKVQDELASFLDLTIFDDWDKKTNDQMVSFETNLKSH